MNTTESPMTSLERPPPGVLVALDYSSAEDAVRMARRLVEVDGLAGFKVGLELLMGPGPGSVAAIRSVGLPIFVDAKLHDIPATVHKASGRLARLGARWLTVHAAGGKDMISAAVEGLSEFDPGAGVIAVTVLTSLDDATLASTLGLSSVGKLVGRLASSAQEAGAEGVVCSVRELGVVADVAPDLIRITPGIRSAGDDPNDQKRFATATEAAARGADLVVVGRAVTKAAQPEQALTDICNQLIQV